MPVLLCLFLYRLVRAAHWDPNRLEAIKGAYRERCGDPLEACVKGENERGLSETIGGYVRDCETTIKSLDEILMNERAMLYMYYMFYTHICRTSNEDCDRK